MSPRGARRAGAPARERRPEVSVGSQRAAILRSDRLALRAKTIIKPHALARCARSDPDALRSSADTATAARLTRRSGLMRPRHIVVASPRLMTCIPVRNPARAEGVGEPRAGRACMGLRATGEGDAPQPRTEVPAKNEVDLGPAGHRKAEGQARDRRSCIEAPPDMGHDPVVGDPAAG